MGRPISERLRRASYWYADQLPHWGVGLVISAVVSCSLIYFVGVSPVSATWSGLFVSLYIGWIRELVQNWGDAPSPGSVEDTTLDMIFWGLGAFTGVAPVVWF